MLASTCLCAWDATIFFSFALIKTEIKKNFRLLLLFFSHIRLFIRHTKHKFRADHKYQRWNSLLLANEHTQRIKHCHFVSNQIESVLNRFVRLSDNFGVIVIYLACCFSKVKRYYQATCTMFTDSVNFLGITHFWSETELTLNKFAFISSDFSKIGIQIKHDYHISFSETWFEQKQTKKEEKT